MKGVKAILLWSGGRIEPPAHAGLASVYELGGPVFETDPESGHYILAPMDAGDVATALYEGRVSAERFRRFLSRCHLATGRLSQDLGHLLVREEVPLLPLLDRLGSEPAPPLPYDAQIECFLVDDATLPVRPDIYQAMLREEEFFGTASVCEECGQAEDVGVFLWTRKDNGAVRVNFVIQNQGGIWRCWIAPFAVPVPIEGEHG